MGVSRLRRCGLAFYTRYLATLSLAVLLALCTAQPVRAQELGPAEVDASIEARMVTDDDFARHLLYSWTTRAQAETLRRDQTLLVATADSGDGPTPFNRALRTVSRRRDEHGHIARALLTRDDLRRRRYAWTSPFATAKPRGKRSYGQHLIAVRLRRGVWFAHFEPGLRRPFRVVDSEGQAVSLRAAVATPERIAAVYHTRRPPAVARGFREYVLCNPAGIESWSMGTPEIRARVDEELGLLRTLAQGVFERRVHGDAFPSWRTRANADSLAQRYRATLAFDIRHYRLRGRRLRAVAEALAAYAVLSPPLLIKNEEP